MPISTQSGMLGGGAQLSLVKIASKPAMSQGCNSVTVQETGFYGTPSHTPLPLPLCSLSLERRVLVIQMPWFKTDHSAFTYCQHFNQSGASVLSATYCQQKLSDQV